MKRMAFLTSADMLPDSPTLRADGHEFTLQYREFSAAFAARGMSLEAVVWDAGVHWDGYDAAIIGTTWDYWDRAGLFLATLEGIAERIPLFNPPAVARWNLDKGYLGELARAGAPVPPTIFAERAEAGVIGTAFDEWRTDRVVVKPRVGAAAWRLVRIERGAPIPDAAQLPPGPCLIQPYLPGIETGEVSLLYYDGVYSHAVRKVPRRGDFRVQSMYGAREGVHTPDEAELQAAAVTLAATRRILALSEPLVYARVDLTRDTGGAPVLMELELVEPYHYPEQGPGCGERMVEAVVRRS